MNNKMNALAGLTTHAGGAAGNTCPPREPFSHTNTCTIQCLQKRKHLTRDPMVGQRIAWDPEPTPTRLQATIRAHDASELPTTRPSSMRQRSGYREGRDRSLSQFPRAGTPSPETQSELSPHREGWVPHQQYLNQRHTCGRHTGGRLNLPPPPDPRQRLSGKDAASTFLGIKHDQAQAHRAQAKRQKPVRADRALPETQTQKVGAQPP